jgi:heme-degrading monooxygenase HmoA
MVVWEFRVHPGAEAEFEKAYGHEGAWVRLFSGDPAYGGTKLVRDMDDPSCYLTLDYWASPAAYESFKDSHVAEYGQIDGECEKLTAYEKEIGRFESRARREP